MRLSVLGPSLVSAVNVADDGSLERRFESLRLGGRKLPGLHPNRKGIFHHSPLILRHTHGWDSSFNSKIDFGYFEWIRQLSNVSALVRRELGSALWARTQIFTTLSDSCFAGPLLDRPNIVSGMKSMTIKVPRADTVKGRRRFDAFLTQLLALKELKLERLYWDVHIKGYEPSASDPPIFDLEIQIW